MSICRPNDKIHVQDQSEVLTKFLEKAYPTVDVTTKLQIIHALDNGQCIGDVAKEYGVESEIIVYIYSKKDIILRRNRQKYKLLKEISDLNPDQKLLNWIEQEFKIGKGITEEHLHCKALEIFNPLSKKFTSIDDWLFDFRMRHNILRFMSNDVCNNTIKEEWKDFLKSFDTKDIYIGGACALAYNFDYNSYFNSEKIESYVSILFAVNTVGSDMREAAVVSKEPLESLPQVKSLPINYYYCKYSQVTYSIIVKYLTKWDNELLRKGQSIVLVLDVPESFTRRMKFGSIRVISSAELAYMRLIKEKIVECFKYHYRKLQISRMLTYGKDNCKYIDYIHMIGNAWYTVSDKYVRSVCLPPDEGNLYFNVDDDNDHDHSITQWCKQYNVTLNEEKCASLLDNYIFCDMTLPCVKCDELDENIQALEILSQKDCQSTSGIDGYQAMKRLVSYLQSERAGDSIMNYAKYLENQMEYGALLQMHQIINDSNDSM